VGKLVGVDDMFESPANGDEEEEVGDDGDAIF
jgi:hypothetical protein